MPEAGGGGEVFPVELNVRNVKGLRALDISDIFIQDAYDARIRGALQEAGAIRGEDSGCDNARIRGTEGDDGDGDESNDPEWMNSTL